MAGLVTVLAATVAAAAAPVPRFQPVAGQRYRLLLEDRPAAGGDAYVFTAEHDLVFARDGTGWTATLTLRRLAATAPPVMARMFRAGQQPLVDRPMVFHLDLAGRIVGLDGQEPLIRDLAAAIDRAAADGHPVREGSAARLAAPLLAMPPSRRLAFLSSSLATALAAGEAARPPGIGERVTIAGDTPGMAGATLTGTQDVIREATGAVVIRVRATGTGAAGARARLSIDRRVDPVHGLLLREDKVVTSVAGDDAGAGDVRDVTTTTLVPVL